MTEPVSGSYGQGQKLWQVSSLTSALEVIAEEPLKELLQQTRQKKPQVQGGLKV